MAGPVVYVRLVGIEKKDARKLLWEFITRHATAQPRSQHKSFAGVRSLVVVLGAVLLHTGVLCNTGNNAVVVLKLWGVTHGE